MQGIPIFQLICKYKDRKDAFTKEQVIITGKYFSEARNIYRT